jgi:hypothetical protein
VSGKQAKMLMENCDPIWELTAEYRKAILSPIVRYLRCSCCEDSSHCVNVGKAGYRRGLLGETWERPGRDQGRNAGDLPVCRYEGVQGH